MGDVVRVKSVEELERDDNTKNLIFGERVIGILKRDIDRFSKTTYVVNGVDIYQQDKSPYGNVIYLDGIAFRFFESMLELTCSDSVDEDLERLSDDDLLGFFRVSTRDVTSMAETPAHNR